MTFDSPPEPATARDPAAGHFGGKVSRRTLVAVTAWAVPAVVVASAAPALAASGSCQLNPYIGCVRGYTGGPAVYTVTLCAQGSTGPVTCPEGATLYPQSISSYNSSTQSYGPGLYLGSYGPITVPQNTTSGCLAPFQYQDTISGTNQFLVTFSRTPGGPTTSQYQFPNFSC